MAPLRLVLASIALLSMSCSHGEILRRYARDQGAFTKKTEEGLVSVSAFVMPVPPKPSAAGVSKLSDRGQEALVAAVDGMSSSNDALYATLAKPFGGKKTSSLIDRTRFDRRIVISAIRDFDSMRNPADRIHDLRTQITLQTAGAKFVSWSQFTTEEETINLGKLSLKKGRSTKLSLSGTIPGTPASVSGEQSFKREQAEEVQLGLRRVKLAGALSDKTATLYQQGVRNVDLSGTFAVDVKVQVDPIAAGDDVLKFSAFKTNGAWVASDKIEFSPVRLRVPSTCGGPLLFSLGGKYRVRRVTNNDRTYSEGDDCVEFIDGKIPNTSAYTLLSEAELRAIVFRILRRDGLALSIRGFGEITLETFGDAVALLNYVEATGSRSLNGRRLGFEALAFEPLTRGQASQLTIESLQINQCAKVKKAVQPTATR